MPWYKNKIILLVIAIVTLFVVIVSVVLLQQNPKKKVAVQQSGPIELTWWKGFYGTEVYADIIKDYQALPGNKDVKINVVKKVIGPQSDYYGSLIADIAKGAGPDIFTLRNDDLPAYREYMAPINTFQGTKLIKYQNDFVDLAVRDTIYVDKVYAITSYVDNMQLFYNKNILSQSGIAIVPKTWSELDKQLAQLNKRNTDGITFKQYGIAFGTGGLTPDNKPANINRHQDIIPLLIFQNGGQLYDYQTSKPVFGDTKTKKADGAQSIKGTVVNTKETQSNPTQDAIQYYLDFADIKTNRYSWNTAAPNNIDAFVDGNLAYMAHYSYMQDILNTRNSRLQYDVAELPQVDVNNKRTYGFFFMDGLNRKLELPGSEYKYKKAQDFMEYLAFPEVQQKFLAKTGLPGSRKDVIATQQSNRKLAVFANGSLYADNYLKNDVDSCEKLWSDLIERVQYKNITLKDSLATAVDEYQRTMTAKPRLRR
jgi:ABC-type glycerol-3-phosphate transport system substrate-binding protein